MYGKYLLKKKKKKKTTKKERRGVELNEMLSCKKLKNYKMMMTRTL